MKEVEATFTTKPHAAQSSTTLMTEPGEQERAADSEAARALAEAEAKATRAEEECQRTLVEAQVLVPAHAVGATTCRSNPPPLPPSHPQTHTNGTPSPYRLRSPLLPLLPQPSDITSATAWQPGRLLCAVLPCRQYHVHRSFQLLHLTRRRRCDNSNRS